MSDPRETGPAPRDGADPQVPVALSPPTSVTGPYGEPRLASADDAGAADDAPAFAAPPPERAWPMYRAMVGIGLACGLLIVSVFQFTAPAIAANRAEALQRAIFEVLPAASSSRSYALVDDERFEPLAAPDPDARVVHAGFDDGGRLVGLAIEAQGMGYADVITLLYGYSHVDEQVVGMAVLQSKETPGLGDRIESDPDFVANVARLDAALDDAGGALRNPIVAVKHGKKRNAWEVDGNTGATISSVAVAGPLDRSCAYWGPRIRARLDDSRAAGTP